MFKLKKYIHEHASFLFVCSFIVMTLLCYREFLAGAKIFVSTNDAMDMYDQFYPDLVNMAKHIEQRNTGIQMDFSRALGMEFSIGVPTFSTLPAYFGSENVVYLIGLMQVFKVLIAGICFYFYIILTGKKPYIASICSVAYAFCGHMIIRQYWLSYATEVAIFAFWLLAYELWERKKNRALLPLATVIFVLNLSSIYYLVLYLGIMAAYIIFRAIFFDEISLSNIKKVLFQIALCTIIAVIIFGGISQIWTQLSQSVSSERFQTGVSSNIVDADKAFLDFPGINTLICRIIGVNILGSGKAFSGIMDYLRAPTYYIGLLGSMLIIPIFLRLEKRQKICAIFVGVCISLYTFINALRKFANGFADDGYKMSSFWIIVVMIFIVAQGLDLVLTEFGKRDLVIFIVEAIAVEGVCIYNLCQTSWNVSRKGSLITVEMTALYAGAFIFLYFCRQGEGREITLKILMLFVFVEAGLQMENTLQEMRVMNREDLAEKSRYNDYTVEALEYLEQKNRLQDYRIDKQYFSYRYNDAWIQNYYGTSFYYGGAGVGRNVIDLYEMMKLPCTMGIYKYAHGTSPYTELNTMLGVKYVINQRTPIINYGYEQIYEENGIYVLENQQAIPIGYGYDQYISREEYEQLDLNSRRKSVVKAGILDDIADVEDYWIKGAEMEDLCVDYNGYGEYRVDFSMEEGRNVYYLPRAIEEDEILVICARSPLEQPVYRGIVDYYTGDQCICYTFRMDPEDQQVIEINAEGTYAFGIADREGGQYLEMAEVTGYIIPKAIYYDSYKTAIDKLRKGALEVDNFSGEYISGTVDFDKDKVFCLAVPYGNWKIFIDGKEADTFLVNVAFTGCVVEEGKHVIEARYSNVSAEVNIIVQYVVASAALIWMIVSIICIRRKKNANGHV